MKKYTKPSIEIVELSVRESLSDLPQGFNGTNLRTTKRRNSTATFDNVTVYKKTSAVKADA